MTGCNVLESTSTRLATVCLLAALLISGIASVAVAQQPLQPSDPIASVDGEPILLGELNYLLISKLRASDLAAVRPDVNQASAALLVKRHMALKSLKAQGGASLAASLDREWSEFVGELRRSGVDLETFCKQRSTDEIALRQSRDFDTAWRIYLKSRMTDENLKRFYQSHPETYSQSQWNVSHLFLAIDSDQPDSKDIAAQRMGPIADQLHRLRESPEQLERQFAELAAQESDGATAKEGGRIGWVSKAGDLPKTVMDAVRSLQGGAVSDPILSPLGYHLVLVHEKQSQQVPFEQVADLAQVRRDAADTLFAALVSRQNQSKITWHAQEFRPPNAESK